MATSRLAVAVLLAVLSGPAAAGPPDDLLHEALAVVPRTADEVRRVADVKRPPDSFDAPEAFEANPGGAATVAVRAGRDTFSQPAANLDPARGLDFRAGRGLFRKLWVAAPSSTRASDGLGPLYSARSCEQCHLREGRGAPPAGPEDAAPGLVLRLSVPAPAGGTADEIERYLAARGEAQERTRPEPAYGSQLQGFAVAGQAAEARLSVQYSETEVTLAGGERVMLRAPVYEVTALGYGPLSQGAMLSPRIAPQMVGLGLLEAVPAADILALADPDDRDGDGVSGRAQIVWSGDLGRIMLGRFGHKAGMATIRDQVASALATDIGISSPLHPGHQGDCTAAQTACLTATHGGDERETEIDGAALDLLAFYVRNLAVPARRDPGGATVLAGKRAFHAAGCPACHQPKFVTDRLDGESAQSFQLIWPYSDLLLHDMGEGLADHRPEARATGREWRTAPLWGIGLSRAMNGHATFLHDGRARSLLEAIIWHGGEAEAARKRVAEMPKEQRDALIRFLESL